MALAITEPVTEAFTNSGLTCSLGSFTPTPGALLVVHVGSYANNADGTLSNTGTSLSWTLHANQVSAGAADRALRVYSASVPPSVSPSVITHTLTGATPAMTMSVLQVTGQRATSPVVQSATDSQSFISGGLSSLSGLQINNAYIAAIGRSISKTLAITSTPSLYTSNGEISAGSGTTLGVAMSTAHRITGESGSASILWSFNATADVAATFLEIAPSPGLTIKMLNYE